MRMLVGTVIKPVSARRDKIGRFARKARNRAAWVIVVSMVAIVAYSYGVADHGNVVMAQNIIVSTTTPMSELKGKSVEQLKDEVIAKLSNDENGDPNKVPVKMDDNNKGTLPAKDKFSYGCMQYKNSTVQRHYKAIYGKDLTNLEAVLLALDCDKAKALAREAIFGKPNAVEEWTMATPPVVMRVKIIREMSN